MIKSKKQAFTLVELIVVITILAILGTIAFISLQGYSAQARDSKRLSDISNIKKSLELFSLNTGKYPLADDYFTVSYSGEELRHQGTVGNQVSTNLSRNLNEKPLDPSTGIEYTYSTTDSQTEYEVLGLYESDLLGMNVGTPLVGVLQSNAETQDYPKIDGNYNGIYIKTSSFYVPTPSIINAELSSSGDLDNNVIKSQIITGGNNLPGLSTGGLDVSFSPYEGTITENSTDTEKSNLVQAIKTAYIGSDLASNTMYADILSRTSTGEMVDFVDLVVLGSSNYASSNSNTNDDIGIGGNDEYTVLLMHGENMIDYSTSNNILSAFGDSAINDIGKFEKSIYFDGNGDYLTIDDSEDLNFGGEDFTIDTWVNFESLPTGKGAGISAQWNGGGGNDKSWTMNYNVDSTIMKFAYSIDGINNINKDFLWTPSLDTWYHIALTRNGADLRFYVDGIQVGNTLDIGVDVLYDSTNYITIGTAFVDDISYELGEFNGYLDEIRISKGIARWTEDFTPPSEPYSE